MSGPIPGRRSTWILGAVFVLTLWLYLAVRPDPVPAADLNPQVSSTQQDPEPAATRKATPTPKPEPTPESTPTPTPTATPTPTPKPTATPTPTTTPTPTSAPGDSAAPVPVPSDPVVPSAGAPATPAG